MKTEPGQSSPPSMIPHLMPWYVHLLGGNALTGIFPWFLVSWQFYSRGRVKTAILTFFVNTLLLAAFSWWGVYSWLSWDRLLLFFMGLNLLWSMSAWGLQHSLYGPAPRRYRFHQWRTWVVPVLIALLLALGLSVIASFFPVIEERVTMYNSGDILDKKVILWDFLQSTPLFLPYGLVVGIWWAGEGADFSPSHVLTYLGGLLLFTIILSLSSMLFIFLFYKGFHNDTDSMVTMIPEGVLGLKRFLRDLQELDATAFVILPLLLGAAPRIRDFWKRSLAIMPPLCVCFISLAFYAPDMWSYAQSQILYDMSSPGTKDREQAHRWAGTMLHRYPDHDSWPEVAIDLARYHYENSEYQVARGLYADIVERFGESPRFHWEVEMARAALSSPAFGSPNTRDLHISMPLLSYEDYMRPNWMSLLRVMRYYDGEGTPESETLIRLKRLSKRDDSIRLPPMPGLAELDDSVANLGLELLILPVDITRIKELLRAGIPVIQPIYQQFYLVSGIDESRSLVKCSGYQQISKRQRKEDWAEVLEILSVQEEGQGQSWEQQERIDQQVRIELPLSFWGSILQEDSSPLMGVVYPSERETEIASAFGGDLETVKQQSKGYLAALVSLNFLNSGDPVQSLQWARLSSDLIRDPLPLHVAYLAGQLWQSREKQSLSNLDLEQNLLHLREIQDFFADSQIRVFLEKASRQFHNDRATRQLSWVIRKNHRYFLDRSDSSELEQLIESAQQEVTRNPGHRPYWTMLADLYQLENNSEKSLAAYEGALRAGSWDKDIVLQLIYFYVRNDKMEEARKYLAMLDGKACKFEADYFFCKAAVARWEGKTGKALRLYKRAIEMRRYVSLYHLDYGSLLLEQGKNDEAYKALDWARSIDVGGEVKIAAEGLLKRLSDKRNL